MATGRTDTGAELLRTFVAQFRKDTGTTHEFIAVQCLKTNKATFSEWLSGKSTPKALHRSIIAVWTGGEVPKSSWETTSDREVLASIRYRDTARAA